MMIILIILKMKYRSNQYRYASYGIGHFIIKNKLEGWEGKTMSDREVKFAICPRVLKTKRREYEISDPIQSNVSLTTFDKAEIISSFGETEASSAGKQLAEG